MLKSCCSCYSFVSFHFSAVHCVVCRLEFQVADKKWCRTSSKVSFDSLKTSVPRGEARAKGSPKTFSVPQASFRTTSLKILTYHILPPFHIDCRWGVAFECLDSLHLSCIWTPLPTFRESLMNPARSYNDPNKETEGVAYSMDIF